MIAALTPEGSERCDVSSGNISQMLYSALSPGRRRVQCEGDSPMAYLLGIDIGTSGTKTLICDQKGKVLATAMAEHPISSPKPGWSEQNPEDWWKAVCIATRSEDRR